MDESKSVVEDINQSEGDNISNYLKTDESRKAFSKFVENVTKKVVKPARVSFAEALGEGNGEVK